MNQIQIEYRLRDIIAQILGTEVPLEHIRRGPGLLEQLHIDSLVALRIIVRIEQDFNVTIDDDEFALEMLDSLDKVAEYIAKFVEPQSRPLSAS